MAITSAARTTARAILTGISRVSIKRPYAFSQTLVLNEILKLSERPRLMNIPLGLSHFGPLPDMLQVFYDENILRAGAVNYSPADNMIDMANYPALLARQPLQELNSPLCAFSLQRCPQIREMPPDMHSLLPRESESIRCNSEIVDAQVNPDRLRAVGSRNRDTQHDADIESLLSCVPAIHYHSGGRFLPFKKMALIVAQNEWNFNPALDSGQGNHLSTGNIAEDALVVTHRRRLKLSDLAQLLFRRFRYPGNSPDSEVCRKPMLFPYCVIAKVLKLHLVCGVILFRYLQHVIAGTGKTLKRYSQCLGLIWSGIKFTTDCLNKFHVNTNYITLRRRYQAHSSPALKCGASCA